MGFIGCIVCKWYSRPSCSEMETFEPKKNGRREKKDSKKFIREETFELMFYK